METSKWNNVLVEWVNCLKLSKPIATIEDLRDGDFLSNLQKLICKATSPNPDQDTLTFIFNLFEEHYPNYSITADKQNVHLHDLSVCDLNCITSLLMHYTCIFDRRDVLTSPLCHSLSQNSQVFIKNFFERVSKNVTRAELKNIFECCVKSTGGQWLSPQSSDSPLLDILKTPASKTYRIAEKDKEIARLKAELDLERYEKVDVQEELKLQSERNKKLELQLSHRAIEVSRLRGEIAAFEGDQSARSHEIALQKQFKILKCEIESLEQYILQCDKEVEELQKDKEADKILNRTLEENLKSLHGKYMETENKLQILQEHNNEQENSLQSLQSHCAELEELLSEFQSKNHNYSLEDSYVSPLLNRNFKTLSNTPSNENLANSVVEVQLKELRDQYKTLETVNEDLKIRLDQNEQDYKVLQEELQASKTNCAVVRQENHKLQASFEDLLKKYEDVSSILKGKECEFASLKVQFEEILFEKEELQKLCHNHILNIVQLHSKCRNLELQCCTKQEELKDSKINIERLENDSTTLQMNFEAKEQLLSCKTKEISELNSTLQEKTLKIESMQLNNKNLLKQIQNLQENCDEQDSKIKLLNEEASQAKQVLQEKNKQLEDLNFKLKELSVNYENLNEKFEKQSITLQKAISENSDFKLLICEKDTLLQNFENKLQVATENQIQQEILITKKTEEINSLTENINEKENNYQTLTETLTCIKNELIKEHELHTNKIVECDNVQKKLCKINKELNAKEEVLQKTSLELNDLESKFKDLQTICNDQQKSIFTCNEENNNLKGSMIEMTHTICEVTTKLAANEASFNELKEQYEEKKKVLNSKNNEIENLSSNLLKKDNELGLLENQNTMLQNDILELNDFKIQQNKTIEDLMENNDELNCCINRKEEEIKKLHSEFDDLVCLSNKQKEEISELSSVTKSLKNKLEKNKTLIDNLNRNLEDVQNSLLETKDILEKKDSKLQKLTKDNNSLKLNLADEKNNNISLQNNLQQLQEKINQQNLQIKDLESHNSKLKAEFTEMENLKENIEKEFKESTIHQNELKELCIKHQQTISQINEEKQKLQLNLLEKDELIHNLQDEQSQLNESFLLLQEDFNKNEASLQEVTKENADLQASIEEIGSQVNLLEKLNESCETQLEKLQSFCDEQSVSLEDITKQNNELKLSLNDKENLLNTLRNNLEDLKKIHQKLTENLSLKNVELADLQQENNNLKLSLSQSSDKQQSLTNSLLEAEELKNNLLKEIDSIQKEKNDLVLKLNLKDNELDGLNESFKIKLEEQLFLIKQLNDGNNQLQMTLSSKDDLLNDLKKNSEQLKIQNNNLLSKVSDLEGDNKSLKLEAVETRKTLLDKIETIKSEYEDLKTILNNKESELSATTELFENEKTNSEQLQIENNNLLSKVSDLEEENKNLKLEAGETSKRLLDKIDHLKSEYEDFKIIFNEKESEFKTTTKSLENEKINSEQLQIENNNLSSKVSDLEEDCKNLKIKAEESSKESSDKIESLKSEYEDLKINFNNKESELNATIKSFENELEKQQVIIKEHLSSIENVTKSNGNLEVNLTKNKELMDNLKIDFDKVQIENNKLQGELSDVTKENSNLKLTIEATDQSLQNVEEILKKTENKLETLQESNKQKQQLIYDLQVQNCSLTSEVSCKNQALEESEIKVKESFNDLNNLQSTNEDLQCKYKDLELLLQEAQNTKTELKSVVQYWEKEHAELALSLLKKNEEIREVTKELENVLLKNRELEAELQEQCTKLTDLQNGLENNEKVTEECLELKKNVEELENQKLSLNSLLRNKESQFEKLKEDLKRENEKLTSKYCDLETTLKEKELEIINLHESLTKNKQNLTKLEEDYLNLKEELKIQLEAKEECNKKNEEFRDQLEKVQEYSKKQENNFKSLDEQYKLLNVQYQELIITVNAKEDQIKNFVQQNEILLNNKDDQVKSFMKQHEEMTEALQNKEHAMLKLQDLLLQTNNDLVDNKLLNAKLSEELIQIQEKLNSSETEASKLKEIIKSQTQALKETESSVFRSQENAMDMQNDLIKRMTSAETERQAEKRRRKQLENDLECLKAENARLESELSSGSNNQGLVDAGEYAHVKEAYEKLLEENNKFMMDIDTVKYKRSRDRDEFVRLLKKERDEAEERENRKVREVKAEYEGKLEKMKDKMLRLYREEVNKEMQKVKSGQQESNYLQRTVDDLRGELFEAEQKISMLETKLEVMNKNSKKSQLPVMYGSRESLQSLSREQDLRRRAESMSNGHFKAPNPATNTEEIVKVQASRKAVTLPRSSTVNMYEETVTTTTSRRTSILPNNLGPNIQMEDEEDSMFNDKFLTDLKEGNCKVAASGRESNASRYSELAWRNSMVPAHLKSAYAAEMQMVSPGRFKEEDIKSGNIDLDDSLSKLLPHEKPRQRKDFGTTSYKKPGPPTPSKNGGRLSLQGNEVHPLRERNPPDVKKVTPSRLKDLFRRNASRENSENQSTPRSKRLSIFRKQK